ncbi:MAG: glycosyltransferase family 39 protein [Syntrophotaleaceae bacterium]
MAKGHHLYHEIWSDQPPLLTYIPTLVHQGFPFSIAAARTTILIFSLLLASSLFRVVLRFEGAVAAWLSVILLIFSRLYLELSVSVMVGLPAIALAMLAIELATLRKDRGRFFALLAGVLFGAALLTKMFVMIMLPAILAVFWLTERQANRSCHAHRFCVWPGFAEGSSSPSVSSLRCLGTFPRAIAFAAPCR